MSEFDEEAERERLRQKYEQDKEKRETTERMSELLLQGATMTNAHCSACGNPVFRYEGQEFCATCEQPVDRDDDGGDDAVEVTAPDDGRVVFGDETDAADSAPGTDGDGTDRGATRNEGQAGTATRKRDSRNRDADAGGTTEERPRAEDGSPPPRDADRTATQSTGSEPEPSPSANRQPETLQSTGESSAVTDANVETARASLVRVLTAASRRAENADDPRRALEHVELARETAETLAALRR